MEGIMGTCVMPVSQLLKYIFERSPSFLEESINEQQPVWYLLKNNIDASIFEKMMQYKEKGIDSMIRLRAEEALELQELIEEE
jgi:hypothetical protein